ncbi:MAG: DegT/DnrJ/EryC1/StrS family aminotransferase [Candidatus Palauibacterales bacterium]|nr:DegT/DnrJ/EryC1/StrS family aminotransferase [Candidatus Palauibacterales bacterium]
MTDISRGTTQAPPRIGMSSPDIDPADIEAVLEVLRSGRLALGPSAEAFEARVAQRAGVDHAVAVSSGTAALHLAVRALGLGPGDQVLVPSFTFVASVNALLFEGVTPVFVDIRPDTYNLDPDDIERRVTPAARAVMTVDVFGHPVDWDEILPIARRHDLRIIDDSCEALGAEYRGRPVGGFGDVAAFAFYPNKQITTGEGGMVVTGDPKLAETIRSLRNQGRGRMGAWLHHERLGFNYRMDEMSAALGESQMRRLDGILERRSRVAALYRERLSGLDTVRLPIVRDGVRMSWFVYVVTLDATLDRDRVIESLEAQGVPSRGYFTPVHRQPYLSDHPSASGARLPVTEAAARRTLALPFHGGLTEDEVDRVGRALEKATRS